MNKEMTIARVYALEGQDQIDRVLNLLHDEENILGSTVIRGIAGYGASREIHTSSLLSLSLELPLIIEFYDKTEKVMQVIKKLKNQHDLQHIVSWSVTSHADKLL